MAHPPQAKPLSLLLTVLVHAALLANQAILAVHVMVMKWLTTPHQKGSAALVVVNASVPPQLGGSPLLALAPGGLPALPAGVEAGIHPNIVCSTRCLLATPLLILLAVRQQRLSAGRSVPPCIRVGAPGRPAAAVPVPPRRVAFVGQRSRGCSGETPGACVILAGLTAHAPRGNGRRPPSNLVRDKKPEPLLPKNAKEWADMAVLGVTGIWAYQLFFAVGVYVHARHVPAGVTT